MSKRYVIYLLLFAFFLPVISANSVAAQQNDPVQWNFAVKKIDEKTFELRMTAAVDGPWHIYSQSVPPNAIAHPTSFVFNKNPLIILDGKIKEKGKLIKQKDEVLDETLRYYENKVDFIQILKLKTSAITKLAGEVNYMACTEERCLPVARKSFVVAVGDK
jgi:hypothetical protein